MTDQHDARDALSTEVLADLMTLHGRATPGTWAQGTSSHHTVSKREGKEDYHVANFHHADDASFIDNAHKYMPLLIEEIHRLRAATQPTKPEQQAGGVPAGFVVLPKNPTPQIIEALRTGSFKDWPSDELCRVRYAALVAAAITALRTRLEKTP